MNTESLHEDPEAQITAVILFIECGKTATDFYTSNTPKIRCENSAQTWA